MTDGNLPPNWKNSVLVPTWDNILALLNKLVTEATIDPANKGEFAPERPIFRSASERDSRSAQRTLRITA